MGTKTFNVYFRNKKKEEYPIVVEGYSKKEAKILAQAYMIQNKQDFRIRKIKEIK